MLLDSTRQPVESPRLETAAKAPGSLRVCLGGAVVAAACAGALAFAASLAPSASGYGTHRQLGIPQCSFLARTGWPCPTCGATTSVALAVRGRLGAAWKAHPFGVLLAAALAAAALAGAAQAVTGRPKLPVGRRQALWAAGLLLVALAASWGWKVVEGLASGTLPQRW
jgi:hypothetical protein